jgi:hypothetical protein
MASLSHCADRNLEGTYSLLSVFKLEKRGFEQKYFMISLSKCNGMIPVKRTSSSTLNISIFHAAAVKIFQEQATKGEGCSD